MLGNVTYVSSICAKSMDREYLMTNASWLAGTPTKQRICLKNKGVITIVQEAA